MSALVYSICTHFRGHILPAAIDVGFQSAFLYTFAAALLIHIPFNAQVPYKTHPYRNSTYHCGSIIGEESSATL